MHDDRLKKLEKIKALGVNPYPARFDRTHTTKEAKALAEQGVREVEHLVALRQAQGDKVFHHDNDVRIAGRIMTLREHGKLIFAQLQDQEGRMQICWMKGFVPETQFEFVKLLDLGDFVGCTGELFKTKHGETTLLLSDCQLLAKSLRPLPEKWHGLKDQETCYRQRHLDLVMNEGTRERFLFRSKLVQKLREFYTQHGFVEIETPVLENISSGASAKPFITHHNALDIEVYLRIAAGELWQKTAIVGGFEKTFEVARVFRNEGMDPSHLQEFTMVEHYAAYWDFEDNMKFTETMFDWLLKELLGTTRVTIKDPQGNPREVDFKAPWPRQKFYDLIKQDSGIDVASVATAEELRLRIKGKGIEIEGMETMGFGGLVDHLYKKVSRPKLIGPVFVIEHPVEMKPLARKNDHNGKMCDTFQLLVSGWEVINAYGEIVDPLDQRARFEEQAKAKAGGDEEAMSFNEEYLCVMEHGMPPMSGWGMGIDRLVTLLTQQDNLKDVVLFPLMRPAAAPTNSTPLAPLIHLESKESIPMNKRGMDGDKNIDVGITYDQARALFDREVKNVAIRNHSREAEVVMRALAKHFGAHEEAWGILGLLHDIDWDPDVFDVKNHGIKSEEILRQGGMSEAGIHLIQSHVYGIKGHDHPYEKMERSGFLEHALACGETITGFIYACALVRPDKKLASVEVRSVKKKFKEKSFAAGAQRDVIMECEKIGLMLEQFIEIALRAMQGIAGEIGL